MNDQVEMIFVHYSYHLLTYEKLWPAVCYKLGIIKGGQDLTDELIWYILNLFNYDNLPYP